MSSEPAASAARAALVAAIASSVIVMLGLFSVLVRVLCLAVFAAVGYPARE